MIVRPASIFALLLILPLAAGQTSPESWPEPRLKLDSNPVVGNPQISAPAKTWETSLAGGVVALDPPVVNGTLYAGTSAGLLYALDMKNGHIKWKFDANQPIRGSPAIVDDIIYFSTEGEQYVYLDDEPGFLYAISAEDGTMLWRHKLGYFGTSPVVRGDVLYLAHAESALRGGVLALGIPTKDFLYNLDLPNMPFLGGMKVDGDYGFVGLFDGAFLKLDLGAPDIAGRFDTHEVISSTPSVWPDSVFFTSTSGNVYSLNRTTMLPNWVFTADDKVFSSPAVDTRFVAFGSKDGGVYLVDRINGTKVWRAGLRSSSGTEASPTLTTNHVVIGADDGVVYFINITTGKTQWEFDAGGAISGGITFIGNALFFVTNDGTAYRLDMRDTTPAPPSVSIRSNLTSGIAPLAAFFNVTVRQGKPPITYTWSINDVPMGENLSLEHTFTQPGEYVVKVLARDSLRRAADDSIRITVTEPPRVQPEAESVAPGERGNGSLPQTNTTPGNFQGEPRQTSAYPLAALLLLLSFAALRRR